MKKKIITIALLAFVILSTPSCNKAGTDGEATLVVFAQHHGRTIPNKAGYPDSVYVKFNTQDLPADPTHNYDAVYVGETGEDHVHCTTLHTGKYYLYATGWDTTINQRVSGGMAIKIKHSERKKEIDMNVPVTE
jgi:hypothetical protein